MNTLEKIRYLRFIHHYTQKDIAEKIGIGSTNYCCYESEKRNFTIEHIKKLAEVYDVSLNYLLDDNTQDYVITNDQLETLIKARDVINDIEKAKNEQAKISKIEK